MASPIKDIFRIPDLRKKILYTIGVLIVFRIGTFIPIPGVDMQALQAARLGANSNGFSLSDYFNFFSGGAFNNYSIFMLGIMPYISMSIIMQLLLLAIPTLRKISEEDGGQKKIKRYTRWGTLGIALIQSLTIPRFLLGATSQQDIIYADIPLWAFNIVSVITVTTGALILMWMGEQITARGIGNGASLIIFAGIIARMPSAVRSLFDLMPDQINPVFGLVALGMYIGVIVLVIYEQQALRKIPVHYSKRIVGNKMYQGQSSYIPFKINPSGVIPVIFGQAVLTFLISIFGFFAQRGVGFLTPVVNALNYGTLTNSIVYALLIIFFAYFYTQITMNPIEISRQIRENGGSIPGIRSYEQMVVYLTRVLNRIVLPGSIFLAFIALIPTILISFFNFPRAMAYLMGGTSLLILVGVDLDTMSQIEGHLKMHNHDGLIKGGRLRSRNF